MYAFLGGISRITFPDKLHTNINNVANSYEDLVVKKSYHERALYDSYCPRSHKPIDKENVAGIIKLAGLRLFLLTMKFFTIVELNRTVECKLRNYNDKHFKKVYLSKNNLFLHHCRPGRVRLLNGKATANFNYHISMDVLMTNNIVEIFYTNHRFVSHLRITGNKTITSPVQNICRKIIRNIYNGMQKWVLFKLEKSS